MKKDEEYEDEEFEDEEYENEDDTDKKSKSNKKSKTSQYLVFLIMTVFVGIIVCILAFAMALNAFSNSKNNASKDTSKKTTEVISATEIATTSEIKNEELNITGIIKEISSNGKQLDIHEIETSKNYKLSIDGTTSLKNKYSQNIVFAELNIGDVVDVSFDKKESLVKSVIENSQVWEQKEIRGVKIDTVKKTIVIGNDIYIYDDEIISLYKNNKHDLKNISDVNTVTVRGLKGKVLYIDTIKSHGYLTFINKDKIKDGTVEVDTDIYINLIDAEESQKIVEGAHQIVVKGTNIEPYLIQTEVQDGKINIIDLKDVPIRAGTLEVKVSETDFVLYVDSLKVDKTGPIELSLGSHNVKVTKEGFLPFEADVEIKSEAKVLEVNLEKEIKLGKVSVKTNPSGAEIYIDNAYIGLSPVETKIEYGSHKLLIKKEGYLQISNNPLEINETPIIFEVTLQSDANALPFDNTTTTKVPAIGSAATQNNEMPQQPQMPDTQN